MLRSLFSGISGLRSNQVRMDVIGNNVANANTVAFKAGRVNFREGFSQMLQGPTRPGQSQGGANAMQVGLGSQVGSIDVLFSQGNLETSGLMTDLAIQGDSFFAVKRGGQQFFTRAGNFQLNADGTLVAPGGYVLQGRLAQDGVFAGGIGDVVLPFGQKAEPRATESARLAGNLNASAEVGPTSRTSTSITVFDALGNAHELTIEFEKADDNQWSWTAQGPDGEIGTGTLTFDPDTGLLVMPADLDTLTLGNLPGGAPDITVNLLLEESVNGLTQFAGRSTTVLRDQDGFSMGILDSFTIDRTGTVMGVFTNGVTRPLAQIALANFNNPGGLLRSGDNVYSTSPNSGGAVLGFSGDGTDSQIISGALEMSNVDLAQEFTNMIIAQRGFQASGRIITTGDEMLQEVVSLKR
jgi:flagellar hook protein FlgE